MFGFGGGTEGFVLWGAGEVDRVISAGLDDKKI